MVRSNKGRQKIVMEKMVNVGNLQVTFSKRRFGLFKKASELCTLCGAEILLIVFSPGGKVYAFGHPDVRELIDRFLNRNHNSLVPFQPNNRLQLAQFRPDLNIQYLNDVLTFMVDRHEEEKEARVKLEVMRQAREKRGSTWYEKDVKDLDMRETQKLIHDLEDVKKKLMSEMSQHSLQNYMVESSGFTGGSNDDGGMDLQFDPNGNAFNYNPNMYFPNHAPFVGYTNDEFMVPMSNLNYMSSYNNESS
ncbi:hypothetical protein CARUB_v10007644mg [Capsella rubella]|uniref:MADS-box domain-containing protein n=1 Tax=Capsella rubella TaxID=81985 RepID=R0GQ66_9BRAS|nr:agamous-like MADS-box protein AGL62 [Capsella rubella]EOA18999.1 hypothetical protein CARUB_v10007644mg [Capsella rubella]